MSYTEMVKLNQKSSALALFPSAFVSFLLRL